MSNLNVEIYDALLEARVKETTARAAAQSVTSNDQVATKADVAEVNAKIAGVETKLSEKIATLTGIQQEQRWLLRAMFVATAGILIKLIFFSS